MTQTLAGDFDYDTNGRGYALSRRPDPRIATLVHAALGDARAVPNVVAGAGSYEPHAAGGLSTFGAGDVVLYRRLTLVIRDDVIEHVFHPIAALAMHAVEVLQWLTK